MELPQFSWVANDKAEANKICGIPVWRWYPRIQERANTAPFSLWDSASQTLPGTPCPVSTTAFSLVTFHVPTSITLDQKTEFTFHPENSVQRWLFSGVACTYLSVPNKVDILSTRPRATKVHLQTAGKT